MTSKKNENTAQAPKRGKNADRKKLITELFKNNPSKRYTLKSLASGSGGADRVGRSDTSQIVEELIREKVIQSVGSGKYRLDPSARDSMQGTVDMLASGSAYIRSENLEKDTFIRAKDTAHALHGDKVKFLINKISKDGTPEGEILSIVERSPQNYVGVIEVSDNYSFVRIDSPKVPVDVYISKERRADYKDGDKVLVHITEWLPGSKNPTGEVIKVFGVAGDNNAEMHAILAEYDLPYEFEKSVMKDAANIPGEITAKDYAERRDMRDVTTFTIDPADAKDFDDALSIRKLSDGLWEIGVHIADVTHYVLPETPVETEAQQRATSVYLVDRTVPMLPERLSNELCSLRPNEEKLTFSAVFKIDDQANVTAEWFGRTVTYSDRRFSYEQAQQIIETGKGDLSEEILTLNRLARIMRANRFKNGSISFERDEAKFNLDKDGKPLSVYFKEQKESNQLIEEFMLLANRKVAEFIGRPKGKGANANRTFVYRDHDKPNADKLATFKSFIMKFGYNFQAEQGKSVAREMNRLMGKIKGRYEENIISTLAIRTMAKAYYSTDNIGHYGLAFDYYTHFTSPIRRYPDMMVHRLLAHYLAGGKSPDKTEYEKLCEHSSEMELRASDAERASIKYKMVEFMQDKIGQDFDGHVSGVTEWGIYVELDETHIEGMVPLREMTDDFYSFNQEQYAVEGNASGRKYTLGDSVKIRVLRADLRRKQLDFQMLGMYDFHSGELTSEPEHAPTKRTAGNTSRTASAPNKRQSRGRSKK